MSTSSPTSQLIVADVVTSEGHLVAFWAAMCAGSTAAAAGIGEQESRGAGEQSSRTGAGEGRTGDFQVKLSSEILLSLWAPVA